MLTYYLGYPEWGVPIEIFFLGMLLFWYYPISGHIWLNGLPSLEEKQLWILKLQTYAKLKVPTTQLVECLPAITSLQQFSPNAIIHRPRYTPRVSMHHTRVEPRPEDAW
jgi:hypothetical protein